MQLLTDEEAGYRRVAAALTPTAPLRTRTGAVWRRHRGAGARMDGVYLGNETIYQESVEEALSESIQMGTLDGPVSG